MCRTTGSENIVGARLPKLDQVEVEIRPYGFMVKPQWVDRVADDLRRMVELFTVGPAGILHLDAGRLVKGRAADVTVLDLERRVRVDPEAFQSKSRNTPFAAMEFNGAAVLTIVGGRVVHDAREPAGVTG